MKDIRLKTNPDACIYIVTVVPPQGRTVSCTHLLLGFSVAEPMRSADDNLSIGDGFRWGLLKGMLRHAWSFSESRPIETYLDPYINLDLLRSSLASARLSKRRTLTSLGLAILLGRH